MLEKLISVIIDEIAIEGHKGCSLHRLFEVLDRYHRSFVGEALAAKENPDNNMRSYIMKEILMCHQAISVSVKGEGKLSTKAREDKVRSGAELAGLISDDMVKKVLFQASEHHISRIVYLNSNISELNQNSMNVIEEVCRSRSEGILQANLGKNLGIEPKTIFYHLKAPIESGLVQSTAVAAKSVFTNLLMHQRFIRVKGEEDDDDNVIDVSENSKVICDYHQTRRVLCDLLQKAPNKTLILQDVRLLMREAGFEFANYYLKNMIQRLTDDGCLEKLNVKYDDAFYLCIKLLKHYDVYLAESVSNRNTGPGEQEVSPFGLRYDMSFAQQVYIIIAAYGQRGVTSVEIRKHLNNFRLKEIGIILTLLETNKCQYKIRKVSVNVGKVHGFRYYVSNPPASLLKDIENFRNISGLHVSESENQDLIATPAEGGNAVFRVSSAFHQRKQNLMQLIEESRAVVYNSEFTELYIRRFPSTTGHLIDKQTLYRAALDLQRENKIHIHKVEIPKFGNVICKVIFTVADIDVGNPELSRLIDDIQIKMLLPKETPPNWRDLPVHEMQIERPQIAIDLAAQAKRKTKTSSQRRRSTKDEDVETEADQTDENEIQMETDATTDEEHDKELGPESEWTHRRLRNRKSTPTYVEEISAITPYVLGLIRPKMQRVKYFHMFLFEFLKQSPTKVFQSARLFRELPLDIYLKTLGHTKANESAELVNYLNTGGDTSIPISQLPYPVMKEIYAGGISSFRQHLVVLIKVLLDLGLLESLGSEKSTRLDAEYQLLTEVPLKNFKSGQLKRSCNINSNEDILKYWNELEVLCVTAKDVTENQAPASLSYLFHSHNWGHVQLVNYAQRLHLNRYIHKNEDNTISTPLEDMDQCAHIAEELGIESRNVISYYRRYLAQAGQPWRIPGSEPKKSTQKEPSTVEDIFSKSRKKRGKFSKRPSVKTVEIPALLAKSAPDVVQKPPKVRDLTDEETKYAFLAFCILKILKEKFQMSLSWVGINQNVLAVKFPQNELIPENNLRRSITHLAKFRKQRAWFAAIQENWIKLRNEAVEKQQLPSKYESLLQEVEFLNSLNLEPIITTEPKPLPIADASLPSCKEILESYKVIPQSYTQTHDLIPKFFDPFKSMHLRENIIEWDYSAFMKTNSECPNYMEKQDSDVSEIEALLKLFVSVPEEDYDSTIAFSAIDKYSDELVSKAVKNLREQHVLSQPHSGHSGELCRQLPGRSIKLSKIASERLIEQYTNGILERANELSKKLLVSQKLDFDPDCEDEFMFAALQLFCDDSIQIDANYKCPEAYMMHRKEIEIRGTSGLEAEITVSGKGTQIRACKRSAEAALNKNDELVLSSLKSRLDSGEIFSTEQLLSEIRCNPPVMFTELIEKAELERIGINQAKWRKKATNNLPKIWNKLDGSMNMKSYNGYLETMESFMISSPGVTINQINQRFGILLSPIEIVELLEHLESENKIQRIIVDSPSDNFWNPDLRRKCTIAFIPSTLRDRFAADHEVFAPLL